MARRIFTKGNLLYAAFLLIFTLAIAEIGGRWYLANVMEKSTERKFQFDAYRIYAHTPGFTEHDEHGPRLSINEQGFRRTDHVPQEKPRNTIRVFFLGGSAAHGISSGNPFPIAHVRDDETIDAHLERMLQERFPDKSVEVINAAVTGYKVFQHTAYITAELLNYEPDMIVFFDGYNDHYAFNPNYDQYEDNIYQFWTPRLQHPSMESIFDMFILWASDFSGLARGYYAMKNNRDAQQRQEKLDSRYPVTNAEDVREGYLKNREAGYLRAIRNNLALCSEHDVAAVVCLQPGLIFRDSSLLAPIERDTLLPLLHDGFRLALQPIILQDLDRLTQEHDIPFVDVNPSFNRQDHRGQQLFLDYCHLSPQGSEVAAQALVDPMTMALRKHLAPAPIEEGVDTTSNPIETP